MKLSLLAVATVLAVASFGAQAGTTDTLAVSTNVTAACSVSGGTLLFADVDPLANASTATTGSATIAVTCSNSTPYNIALSAGNGANATVSTRTMVHATDPASTLNYALYRDDTYASNWGETAGTDTKAGTGTGASQNLTVYGKIASGQQAALTGAYSDTVTVTVTY